MVCANHWSTPSKERLARVNIEIKIIQKMEKDTELISFWKKSKVGLHYFRRIDVQKACLKCHGSKDHRPNFVKKGYPNDKAFGFIVGDLRGIYSVFIPNQSSR